MIDFLAFRMTIGISFFPLYCRVRPSSGVGTTKSKDILFCSALASKRVRAYSLRAAGRALPTFARHAILAAAAAFAFPTPSPSFLENAPASSGAKFATARGDAAS